jgi:hypothetical protein
MSKRSILLSMAVAGLALSTPFLLAQDAKFEAFDGQSERGSASIAYFSQPSENEFNAEGGFVITYGRPEWRAEYDEQFDELTKGKRWRFGNNSWTTLDTNVSLKIAGAEVAPGYYYLVLERGQGDDWSLVILDPKPLQKKKMDASGAEETTGGITAPLTTSMTAEPATKLTVNLTKNENDLTKASLDIQWGKRKLSATIDVGVEVPSS